jgi:hypothetical protein
MSPLAIVPESVADEARGVMMQVYEDYTGLQASVKMESAADYD